MTAFVAALGAILGSFLNVCIVRWPQDESVVRPRSRCPGCSHLIAWYDNIPVLSWVMRRARCRHCGAPIALLYPAVELANAALWLGVWSAFGPTLTAVRVALAGTILLGIAVTDLRDYVIPDGFTVTGFLTAFAFAVLAFLQGTPGPFAGPWDALVGACAGAGLIAIIGWLGEVALGKEAMGQGDVTLMAFVGALVGPGRAILTVMLAAVLATVIFLGCVAPVGWFLARRRGEAYALPLVPFGVFLAPAGLVALLWGDAIVAWYVGAFFPAI
ncbi:MAG: prepilin peptidase [Gemmatimonadota bacterium]|nr:prepilin peptidase [Gemmatimonadota bacterium]MDQ8147650.1 prepilin peptidase [Gemmatimonadota bacterium]MDQ8148787.1 prepilin peptidase [Gemmatimonadota bacterium]MDQ8155965.1 prepilin peptidase [Gemmatimonadota bacterium]MDQ8176536.1 prepilin peptidase [Gemmatimonadota bacterium]